MTNLADKIDALAEKATGGPWHLEGDEICTDEYQVGTIWEADEAETASAYDAALIVELVNAIPQITRALRDAERMREALTLAANRLHRCSVEFPTGSVQFIEYGEWAQEARQALETTNER